MGVGVRGEVKGGCGVSGMSSQVHGPAICFSGGNQSAWGLWPVSGTRDGVSGALSKVPVRPPGRGQE